MLKLPRKVPQGSIMVEAIASLAILLLVMVASTPPIITAVVTRIQSRRVAQATSLAQLEIDKVRERFSLGNYVATDMPPVATGSLRSTISATAAPNATCIPNPVDSYCGLSTDAAIVTLQNQKFLVQTFRTPGVNWNQIDITQPAIPIAFRMGVRVYSSTAIANLGSLSNTQAGSSIGLSSNERLQAQAPLVILYVDFVRGDLNASQQAYQLFLTTN